jgi:predicted phage-related endonuclease
MANKSVTEKRDIYIGGSDVREIIDPQYHSSVYNFALAKAGLIESYFDGNKYTRYGELMEIEIRNHINKDYEFVEHCIVDEENKFRGNLDGIDMQSKRILEIKTCGEEADISKYMHQIQFYLELAYRFYGIKTCILAVYKRPTVFYTGLSYSIQRDDNYFETLLDEDNLTIHEIKRDPKYFKSVLPTIERFKKASEMLKANPKMSQREFNEHFYGNKLVLKSTGVTLLQRKINFYKELENELESAKKEIYQIFSERGIKQYSDQSIKITKVDPHEKMTITVDNKKLAKEKPEVYEKYKKINKSKIKGYVRLTVK